MTYTQKYNSQINVGDNRKIGFQNRLRGGVGRKCSLLAGARLLKRDQALAGKWQKIIDRLAPYPTEMTPEGPRLVDVAGARLMTEYNQAGPLAAVVYGDDIGLASPARGRIRMGNDVLKLKIIVREKPNPSFGRLPERTPLNPKLTGRFERSHYIVEKLFLKADLPCS